MDSAFQLQITLSRSLYFSFFQLLNSTIFLISSFFLVFILSSPLLFTFSNLSFFSFVRSFKRWFFSLCDKIYLSEISFLSSASRKICKDLKKVNYRQRGEKYFWNLKFFLLNLHKKMWCNILATLQTTEQL